MARNIVSHSVLTEEEYLAFERASEIKHEFLSGRIHAMAGATREHNLITGNVAGGLRAQLRGTHCETYSNDMRVRIPATGLYTYPDIVVVCGPPTFLDNHRDTLLNPQVIIEVLSSSTEAYDRGEKFKAYRSIQSFSEYVLVSQHKMEVDHFVKQNNIWTIREIDEEIRFVAIACRLTLPEVYERVEFVPLNESNEAKD